VTISFSYKGENRLCSNDFKLLNAFRFPLFLFPVESHTNRRSFASFFIAQIRLSSVDSAGKESIGRCFSEDILRISRPVQTAVRSALQFVVVRMNTAAATQTDTTTGS